MLYWFYYEDSDLYSMAYRTKLGTMALFYSHRQTGYESGVNVLRNYYRTHSITWRTGS